MSDKGKKLAAALAAVEAYLAEEAAAGRVVALPRPPTAMPSLWGLSGRLEALASRLGSPAVGRRSR